MSVTDLVPLAQVAAPIVAAVAAVASWQSARASLRTAGRADETSRRAVEALSRVSGPRVSVHLFAGPAPRDQATVQVSFLTVNESLSNRGQLTLARVERSDGLALAAAAPMPMPIGTLATRSELDITAEIPLGVLSRIMPPDDGTERLGDLIFTATIEYTDPARLATWRQQATYRERWAPADENVAMMDGVRQDYGFIELTRTEPTIVDSSAEPGLRPVGWVRRTWRAIW